MCEVLRQSEKILRMSVTYRNDTNNLAVTASDTTRGLKQPRLDSWHINVP